jgi:hypothetical protein
MGSRRTKGLLVAALPAGHVPDGQRSASATPPCHARAQGMCRSETLGEFCGEDRRTPRRSTTRHMATSQPHTVKLLKRGLPFWFRERLSGANPKGSQDPHGRHLHARGAAVRRGRGFSYSSRAVSRAVNQLSEGSDENGAFRSRDPFPSQDHLSHRKEGIAGDPTTATDCVLRRLSGHAKICGLLPSEPRAG